MDCTVQCNRNTVATKAAVVCCGYAVYIMEKCDSHETLCIMSREY